MPNKEECKRALEYLQNPVDVETKWYSVDILKKLIDEHFEPKENTSEFNHFKLHSDSTLKSLTKDELIGYIKMLYHNWSVCDERLNIIIEKAKELSNSNDELRKQLYFIEPYKFEDLKVGMWIYDKKEDWIYKIRIIDSESSIFGDNAYLGYCSLVFEENRFYPVQMANEVNNS